MRSRSPRANPSILCINAGNSSELVLKVAPVVNAKSYHVRAATIGSDNAPGSWQLAGIFTNSRTMRVPGLVPGTMYVFQVRAGGGGVLH